MFHMGSTRSFKSCWKLFHWKMVLRTFRNQQIRLCSLLLIFKRFLPVVFQDSLASPGRKTCKAKQQGWLLGSVKRWVEEWWKELRGGELRRWFWKREWVSDAVLAKLLKMTYGISRHTLLWSSCVQNGHVGASKQGLWCTTSNSVQKSYYLKEFNFPGELRIFGALFAASPKWERWWNCRERRNWEMQFCFSGWQPRWFLLCGGILSYYDSQEDAWKGCKGSIQMAVCEIQGN